MSKWDELKRLADVATPGPWMVEVSHYPESGDMVVTTDPNGWELLEMREDCPDHEANASFIAAANPQAILALIAENEALRKDAERYRWIRDNAVNTAISKEKDDA